MTPDVFILIPAYNAEKFLDETVKSMINQSFTNWNCLILDDCSTDETYKIAKAWEARDQRIKAERNEVNLGMMANWNKGLSRCNAPFFVKLDADDKWHPQLLTEAVGAMGANDEVGMVFTNCINIDENDQVLQESYIELPEFVRNKHFNCISLVKQGSDKMLSYPILRQGCALIRYSFFEAFGGYLTIQSADTELYFRVGCHFQVFYIDKVYYYYRVHSQSDSSKIDKDGKRQLYLFEVKNAILEYYYKHKKISVIQYLTSKRNASYNYNLYLSYKARIEKKFVHMTSRVLLNLFIAPIKTMSFYWQRVLK